jgi:hypothetical protein
MIEGSGSGTLLKTVSKLSEKASGMFNPDSGPGFFSHPGSGSAKQVVISQITTGANIWHKESW